MYVYKPAKGLNITPPIDMNKFTPNPGNYDEIIKYFQMMNVINNMNQLSPVTNKNPQINPTQLVSI